MNYAESAKKAIQQLEEGHRMMTEVFLDVCEECGGKDWIKNKSEVIEDVKQAMKGVLVPKSMTWQEFNHRFKYIKEDGLKLHQERSV